MKAKKTNTIIKEFKNPQILSIYYNSSELFINYLANPTHIVEIKFQDIKGFKCLDEGDLTSYWDNEVLIKNWIVEILEGGWKDAEISKNNFVVSNQDEQIREFFIMGGDDCITVFAYDEPEIKTTLHNTI
jgi:hypothetical protein